MWVLMSRKTTTAYTTIWDHLKKNIPEFSPRKVTSDFEKAIIKSVRLSFPESNMVSCMFYFCQVRYEAK